MVVPRDVDQLDGDELLHDLGRDVERRRKLQQHLGLILGDGIVEREHGGEAVKGVGLSLN